MFLGMFCFQTSVLWYLRCLPFLDDTISLCPLHTVERFGLRLNGGKLGIGIKDALGTVQR